MFQNNSVLVPTTLADTVIHLHGDGAAEAAPRRGGIAPGRWTVAAVRARSDADLHSDVWERHADGDEVLCAMSGGFDVHVRATDGGRETVVALTAPGSAVVVPAATWHRVSVRDPGDLLAVTRRSGTTHEHVREPGRPR
ncbi:cupin domain-containing protein [Pseudonocardia dioxanivorans]|jgi:mannose-6-phosphate isomerase-like protein (cupin superfamily)|uniref:cupin n=1 Tax=Pseudonocardia dioxanivorans TaxID=240495 RepID=UPI000CD0620B|nr:cupin [Pseudonocardia dioxanivorans]